MFELQALLYVRITLMVLKSPHLHFYREDILPLTVYKVIKKKLALETEYMHTQKAHKPIHVFMLGDAPGNSLRILISRANYYNYQISTCLSSIKRKTELVI